MSNPKQRREARLSTHPSLPKGFPRRSPGASEAAQLAARQAAAATPVEAGANRPQPQPQPAPYLPPPTERINVHLGEAAPPVARQQFAQPQTQPQFAQPGQPPPAQAMTQQAMTQEAYLYALQEQAAMGGDGGPDSFLFRAPMLREMYSDEELARASFCHLGKGIDGICPRDSRCNLWVGDESGDCQDFLTKAGAEAASLAQDRFFTAAFQALQKQFGAEVVTGEIEEDEEEDEVADAAEALTPEEIASADAVEAAALAEAQAEIEASQSPA